MPSRLPASFRDPAGFVFRQDGEIHRYVDASHGPAYDRLMQSGLYEELTNEGLLVSHEEVGTGELRGLPAAHRILRPQQLPFVSYPHEWCFGELREAALLTLRLAKAALRKGMILRDGSAYNVQFVGGFPVFIDTLSFGLREQDQPWPAYRQFCQHFLAPLALMSARDVRLGRLARSYMDGIPLDLAAKLLPLRSRVRPALFVHLVLHARFLRSNSDSREETSARRARQARVSDAGLSGLLESLEAAVASLSWRPAGTEWSDYYESTNYSEEAAGHKSELIAAFLDRLQPESVWDLGANTGRFARLASEKGILSIAFDADEGAVERGFQETRRKGDRRLLHLVQDLGNPSSASGWANEERLSLASRGPADCLLALGLIHHLAIGNNVPFDGILSYFSRLGRSLVLEFVPKSDSQVQRLLRSREDIFERYDEKEFVEEAGKRFRIQAREPIRGSDRVLYLLESLEPPGAGNPG